MILQNKKLLIPLFPPMKLRLFACTREGQSQIAS
jgi:hypothetical protein